jgi:hypothetical protein
MAEPRIITQIFVVVRDVAQANAYRPSRWTS